MQIVPSNGLAIAKAKAKAPAKAKSQVGATVSECF